MVINRDVLNFFEMHDIDFKELALNDNSRISSTKELNKIIADYGIHDSEKDEEVSVADIIGYNFFENQNKNIFYAINDFFKSNGSRYQQRSIELLNYSSDEIMNKLGPSFKEQPICIEELPGNKYLISSNGLHRYMILRIHFLKESNGLDKDSKEYMELKTKYKIPVRLKKVNLIKTYANYLLSSHPELGFNLKLELNDNYEHTGKVILELNNKQYILDTDELIDYLNDVLINTQDPKYFDLIKMYSERYESFKTFINNNFAYVLRNDKGAKAK
ncbi:MAG: hypothetical protein PHP49_03415 [Bacilli bacterium]|nr:hypothetical protein [Bacilli bacterium]